MAVRVVLRHRHRHLGARLLRVIRMVTGGLLLGIGVLVGPVGVVILLGFGAELMGRVTGSAEPDDAGVYEELPWSTSTMLVAGVVGAALLVLALTVGLRLLRHGRTLILFLRRFRDADAIGALSTAAAGSVGGSWRVVTLDDGRIRPLGAPAGTRGLVRGLGWLWGAIAFAGRLAPIASGLLATAMGVVGVKYLLTGEWDLEMVVRALPDDDAFLGIVPALPRRIAPDLDTLFALLVIAGIVLFLISLAGFVAMLAMFPLAGPALLAQSAAQGVERSRALSRASIAGHDDVDRTTRAVVAASRKVLAPRLVVVRVDDGWWRQSVSAFGEVAAATVVDVSEPSENVLWEVDRLRAARSRLVPVGHVPELEALLDPDASDGGWARRLEEHLAGQEVLGYTLTWWGRRRFARALRRSLLCRSDDLRL